MVNEFDGRTFPCATFVPAGPTYANVSASNRICSTTAAKAGLDFVLGTDYLETSFSYEHKNLWRNFGILLAFIVRSHSSRYVDYPRTEASAPYRSSSLRYI